MTSNVYFIQSGAAIKIGVSTSVKQRLASLQTSSPTKLVLLATVEGAREDEARLHRRFANERIAGEWFRSDGTLQAFVSSLASMTPGEARAAILVEVAWGPEYVEHMRLLGEELVDACCAAIRELGVDRAAAGLTEGSPNPVSVAFLLGVLEGKRSARMEWLAWLSDASPAFAATVRKVLDEARRWRP